MLIGWTVNQWAHEAGTFAAAVIALACLVYLVRKIPFPTAAEKQYRKLLNQGIATGMVNKRPESQRRFRLLDLMVVVTLVAALTGLIRGMANVERDGIPALRGKQPNYLIDRPVQEDK
jgi:hypothetical protein